MVAERFTSILGFIYKETIPMSLYPLVQQLRDSKKPAQQIFFGSYSDDMFLICRRYVGIDAVAEDIMMDAFSKFFIAMREFEYTNDKALFAYLTRIMVNECLKYIKRNKKNYAVETLDDNDEASVVTIEETATSSITEAELYKLIADLPQLYRIIFSLFELEGWTHAQIAAALNISADQSSLKLHRAKKLLQKKIKKLYNYE